MRLLMRVSFRDRPLAVGFGNVRMADSRSDTFGGTPCTRSVLQDTQLNNHRAYQCMGSHLTRTASNLVSIAGLAG